MGMDGAARPSLLIPPRLGAHLDAMRARFGGLLSHDTA